jgi:hypothetical protein
MKQNKPALISVASAMSSSRIRESAKCRTEVPNTMAAARPAARPYNRRPAA